MDLGHGVLLALLTLAVIGWLPNALKIDACEKDLPRSQQCKLIAVPAEPQPKEKNDE